MRDQTALAQSIESGIRQLNSSYTLVFPGASVDPRTRVRAGFRWDGQEHRLQLVQGDRELENTTRDGEALPLLLVLAPRWDQRAGGSRWWLWIAIPGAVILLGVLVAARRQQPAAAPPPMVIAPAAVPAPVRSAPPNPVRTIMMDVSGGDGLPVVGWMVPIGGDRQFQTFKLQYGETRIGTTANAHIVLNDGFMSTDHAKVVMSPSGFTLVDNNSTNGTFANERRVTRHELVDNDLIMFGKTVCKFKTILGTS